MPLPAWTIAPIAVAAALLGAWLSARLRRWWAARRLRLRMHRARRGEDDARAWLERAGFTVLSTQVTQGAMLLVDGAESPFTVRADYLVERDGVRAVIEVKTGSVASPAARATRRQILEYAWVYSVRDVYLFDADTEKLHHVALPGREAALGTGRMERWRDIFWALAAGAIVGAGAAWYFLS